MADERFEPGENNANCNHNMVVIPLKMHQEISFYRLCVNEKLPFYFKWWKWLLKRWRTRNFLWRPEITVPTYSFLFWSVERILTIYHGSVIMRSMLGIGVSTMSEYLQQGRMGEMFHWLTILVAFIMAGPPIRQRLFCR